MAGKILLPHDWEPRHYQIPALSALDNGIKRVISVWHRRAGKDSCGLNYIAKAAHQRIGTYWHIMPTQKQARKAIWNGIDRQGRRIIDQAFPKELRKRTLEDEMLIQFRNGSFFQLVGGDAFDGLVGSNPVGVIYSEYALLSPRTWHFTSPILRENDGWAWFNSTPRGNNHFKHLYDINKDNPLWHVELKTILDTGVLSLADIEEERRAGMPEDMIKQEFFCDFSAANAGSIFDSIVQNMRKTGQIGNVPYDPRYPVETWWDIGHRDATSILFVQRVERSINIFDHYEKAGQTLPHFANVVHNKGYSYSRHVFPHDLEVTEWGAGTKRSEQARQHGLNVVVAPKTGLDEGLEAARALLQTCYIDASRCANAIAAFEHYHREWDEDTKTFSKDPVHDWSSHVCSALRYGAVTPSHYGIMGDWQRELLSNGPAQSFTPIGGMGRGNMGHNGGPPLGSMDRYDPLDGYRGGASHWAR